MGHCWTLREARATFVWPSKERPHTLRRVAGEAEEKGKTIIDEQKVAINELDLSSLVLALSLSRATVKQPAPLF